MKRHFGSFLARSFLGRGTTLTEVEYKLTEASIQALPDWLRTTVEMQIDAYDLVQRESDGRALNFYLKRQQRSAGMENIPMLKTNEVKAPLMRLTAIIGTDPAPVHATLNAIHGRVFCVAFDRRVDTYPFSAVVEVIHCKEAWRSTVRRTKP
jgi:hypothetical protein